MHHALSRPLFAGSDNTIIIYYSHKKILLCEKILQNEVINARVYETDDITGNFVTECWIKVQTFFDQCAEKSQLDGLIKYTKKIL